MDSDNIKEKMNNKKLHDLLIDCPLMKNLEEAIKSLIDFGLDISIISGGMHPVAHRIASFFPSTEKWELRFGGIDFVSSKNYFSGNFTDSST